MTGTLRAMHSESAAALAKIQAVSYELFGFAENISQLAHTSGGLNVQNLTMQGKAMTGTLRVMYAESVATLAKMQAMTYDPLDVSEPAFISDYAAYQIVMQSIERRLAAILKQVTLLIAFTAVSVYAVSIARPFPLRYSFMPSVVPYRPG